ncbi:MAG: type 4a pilus biogenesis protein PilO [Candidatus Riflebacteria bacterium]|nr:type 4a pilus biogenesis protein PilO [Candidatus Riflebacteria bacterium]
MAEGFDLKEWIQQAKDDPKVAAQPLIVVLALVYFGYKYLYSPQAVALIKERAKLTGIKGEITKLTSAMANSEELKVEVIELKRIRSEIELQCYKKTEASSFMQDLRTLGKKAGLEIRNLTPLPMVQKTYLEKMNYEEFPVKILFNGDFKQLGMFLCAIETFKKKITIDLPPLVPDASGTFKFELTPTCIVLPENFSLPVASKTE